MMHVSETDELSLRRARRRRRNRSRSSSAPSGATLLIAALGLLFAMISGLEIESSLTSLRSGHMSGSATTARTVLEPGTHNAENEAIARAGVWFTQTLGTTSSSNPSTSVVTSTAGSSLTFTFYGTDLSMTARVGPESGKVHVTVDSTASTALGNENEGSVVDLGSSQAEDASIPIAAGLSHHDHTVVITSLEDSDVAISGFTVTASTPFPWAFDFFYAGLAVLLFVVLRTIAQGYGRRRGWLS